MLPFNPALFWDVDFGKLDWEANKRFIIERVTTLGSWNEFQLLLAHYGEQVFKEEIVKAGALDKKTLSYVNKVFNIPKENFRCYMKKQLHPIPWL
jgi:hypothetical protein